MWSLSILLTLSIAVPVCSGIEDKAYWMATGQSILEEALKVKLNHGVAKNVVLMMGDGMGISTITAARIYKGQQLGHRGENTKLFFETFPHVALSKVYCVDRQTPGSAASGTAYHSGVKVNFGTVGFDANVLRKNCSLVNDSSVRVETVLDWSYLAGKSVGIVTNTRVTHASPAASYAHSADRNWERDRDMKDFPAHCGLDVASQLVKENAHISVVMGGGRRGFVGRDDGQDLVQEWLSKQQQANRRASYLKSASDLRSLNPNDVDQVLGLFTESHMTWELTRDNNTEPSLAEMAAKAIEVLRKNDKGFFLFVEGGRIDHGHHDNWAKRALSETVSFDEAVAKVVEMTSDDDTLVVVTADHSHPFSQVGYPKRGNDILGMVDPVDKGQEPTDGKPYTTLIYGNGPGPERHVNITDTSANDFQFPVAVPMGDEWETHAGEDVGIFARGPMSHLFHGVHEQNYIAHAMAYAACVGPNTGHCTNPSPTNPSTNDNDCTGGVASIGGHIGVIGVTLMVVTMFASL